MKYRGWALFFAAMFGGIALFIVHVASLRSPSDDRLAVAALTLVVVLLAVRFAFAAITGRIPRWMEELIDDPE